MKESSLRTLAHQDAKEIAALHHRSFKEFFLTSLGLNFLETFYKGVLKHRDSVAIGIFKEEKLIGFAIGTQKNTGFYQAILKTNLLGLIGSALPKLFNPVTIKRLLNSFSSQANQKYSNVPVLLSICVEKTQESKGLGSTLLQAFENHLTAEGHTSLILSTDAHNNKHANQFYLNNNYIFVKSFLQGKREMNLYYKQVIS